MRLGRWHSVANASPLQAAATGQGSGQEYPPPPRSSRIRVRGLGARDRGGCLVIRVPSVAVWQHGGQRIPTAGIALFIVLAAAGASVPHYPRLGLLALGVAGYIAWQLVIFMILSSERALVRYDRRTGRLAVARARGWGRERAGRERLSWVAGQVVDVVPACLGPVGDRTELRVVTVEGATHRLLRDRDPRETAWLAGVLREAMGFPSRRQWRAQRLGDVLASRTRVECAVTKPSPAAGDLPVLDYANPLAAPPVPAARALPREVTVVRSRGRLSLAFVRRFGKEEWPVRIELTTDQLIIEDEKGSHTFDANEIYAVRAESWYGGKRWYVQFRIVTVGERYRVSDVALALRREAAVYEAVANFLADSLGTPVREANLSLSPPA